MCPGNKGRTRARRRHAIIGLLAMHALLATTGSPAGEFDIARGQRMLSAALASSAIEHSAGEDVSTPRTPEQQLLMFMISPRYNAYLWAHPETLPHVVDRAVEPGFLLAAYQAALLPEAYLHFASGWTDIEKMRTYFELLDPRVIVAWAAITSDPASWSTTYARLADLGKIGRWLRFATGGRLPEFVAPVATPETYATWLALPFDARTARRLSDLARIANPAQPPVMAGALMDSGMRALRRFAQPYPASFDP